MEIENKTIALLIDAENISYEYLRPLMEELNLYGTVTYRRIYGDFTVEHKGWKDLLHSFAILPIQQYAYTSGKNSSDSAIIIDAMDILYTGKIDCVCLATSDSDFTRLAMRFKEEKIFVIGAGEQKTPQAFRKACDRFIFFDNTAAPPKDKIISIARDIIQENTGDSGYMAFATMMHFLYKKENAFNPVNYDAKTNRPVDFFRKMDDFEIVWKEKSLLIGLKNKESAKKSSSVKKKGKK